MNDCSWRWRRRWPRGSDHSTSRPWTPTSWRIGCRCSRFDILIHCTCFDLLFLICFFLSIICCFVAPHKLNIFFVVGVLESLHKSEGREGTIGEKVFQNLKLNLERFLLIFSNHFCLKKGLTLILHLFVYFIVPFYRLLCSMAAMNEFCSAFILFSITDFMNSKYFL